MRLLANIISLKRERGAGSGLDTGVYGGNVTCECITQGY